ncbi:CoA transferase [Streptomyces noursei]|uniref:CoA transferase n=1 Tax=Streptomyces noursei TaxID=1971 RepID=UPI0019B72E6D|nr:CoA transferase [Streptomyces noursei]MCZ1016352.1 CoA transferase [Streptomyces noursei]GGX00337.1 hypothetical protein GCM10010341_22540 [Streptomyces noursei]
MPEPQHRTAPRALDGVLVADFSRVPAGPLAAATLADLGAEVIKVERPGSGDDTRAWGPPFAADGTAAHFDAANRSERGLVLDPGARETRRRPVSRRGGRTSRSRASGPVRWRSTASTRSRHGPHRPVRDVGRAAGAGSGRPGR